MYIVHIMLLYNMSTRFGIFPPLQHPSLKMIKFNLAGHPTKNNIDPKTNTRGCLTEDTRRKIIYILMSKLSVYKLCHKLFRGIINMAKMGRGGTEGGL